MLLYLVNGVIAAGKEPPAWMLQRNGKSFPCQSHYYANPTEIAKTTYTAEWLYGVTQHDEIRRQIIDLPK